MRFGLDVTQHQLAWPEILRRARLAEEWGFEGIWLFDHFAPLYGDPLGPCLEAWTLLAALAASTERVRLGTLVTGITHRPPSVLAAEALTVDRVSGGRLELAVGAAWNGDEHRALGLAFPPAGERVDRLDEAVRLMKLLFTRDEVRFEGRHYRLDGATLRPRPVQRPHPPIWIGGKGERRMLPLIAREADAWHTDGSLEDLARRSALVDRLAREAGRDPSAIVRASSLSLSQPMEDARAHVDALEAAGFSYLIVDWPSEGEERVRAFAAGLMPALVADRSP